MKKIFCLVCCCISAALISCEKMPTIGNETDNDERNVVLTFEPTGRDLQTRGTAQVTQFTKLNVQMFDRQGAKVFDKVKSQTADDEDFCQMALKLTAGRYTIVAVGHSSARAATINSPEDVRFTASDGEKLTDTFCHCSTIDIGGDSQSFSLPMYRAGAMIQFRLTDTEVPESFAYFLMEYTGGSANFNPTTLEGITKSSQSEKRIRNSLNLHQAFTFPYMAATGSLKMTVSGLDQEGTVIRKRTFEDVPVTRNRITTYTGKFFEDGDGVFTQSDFGFVVHSDWDGEQEFEF